MDAAFPNLRFLVGKADTPPFEAGSATAVVCNAFLLLVPLEEVVRASLREMARVARPGATIWIGEIPEVDEYARYGIFHGTSMLAFLWHLLRHNGMRAFLGMMRPWIKAISGEEQIVLNSAGSSMPVLRR